MDVQTLVNNSFRQQNETFCCNYNKYRLAELQYRLLNKIFF